MSLTQLFLAATLILFGLATLGWLAVPSTLLGGCALITGVLLVLEGAGVWSLKR